MSNRSPIRVLAAIVAAIAVLAALAGGSAAAAQSTDTVIVFRSWACPDGVPSDEWDECDAVIGASYRVEADGVEVAGSPVTTVQDMGIGSGVEIRVPGAAISITVTQLTGAPDGYAPAPGFDPFTATIAELPQVGFGGESMGPGIAFINIPVADSGDEGDETDDGGSTDDSTSGTTTLPETGTGVAAREARDQARPAALLMVAATLFGVGMLTRRSPAS